MANDNQYGFYRDIQLNNGAMVVTVEGGGGSGTSGTSGANGTSGTNGSSGTSGGGGSSVASGTHFGIELGTGLTYNLALTSTWVEVSDLSPFQSRIIAFPFNPCRNIDIQALTMDIYRLNGNTTARLKFLVYSNDAGNMLPKNVLVESTEITPAQFAINQYNVNYTFSAGTTYWLAIAFSSDFSGPVGCTGVYPNGLLTLGPTNITDGWGISYKMAVSDTIASWPTIPSTWVKTAPTGFYGSTILDQGLWGGTNQLPMIRFKTA